MSAGTEMRVAVLGASGATGRLLVEQALARGLRVTALAREPGRVTVPDHPLLTKVAADVHDPGSIARGAAGSDVLVSGLGVTKGNSTGRSEGAELGTLTAGATAAVAAGVGRIVWLGAFGTGPSARAAGALSRTLLGLVMGRELGDKVSADAAVLAAGGTVFHAGPLSNAPAGADRRTVALAEAPRRVFPARVSRATVAAAMLDEAMKPRFAGQVAIPLDA